MNDRLAQLIAISDVPTGIVPAAMWGRYHASNRTSVTDFTAVQRR
jgi:hypothetical protein